MGLNILFGEHAKAQDLSLAEVLRIYEAPYTAVIPSEPWWTALQPEASDLKP